MVRIIEHISLFKFKPEYDNEQVYVDVIEAFKALDPKTINAMEVTVSHNVALEQELVHGFNVGLRMLFRNKEDLQRYLEHPAHEAVASFVKRVTADIVVADLEKS